MHLLHVISECPYPPNKGGRADAWARLLAMAELGFEIDMIIMAPGGQLHPDIVAHLDKFVRRLYVLEQRSVYRCAATIRPTRVSRNARLRTLRLNRSYDLTLMEAEDTLPILDNPTLDPGIRVLRIHNNESRYMAELARTEGRFLRRQFFWLESMRLYLYSRAKFGLVDALWFISSNERSEFLAANPDFQGVTAWLPPGLLDQASPVQAARPTKSVLFVGSLDMALNREAVSWYVEHVHPVLTRDPAYQLVVAGSTQGRAAASAFASALRDVAQCTIHIDVNDLSSLYADCAVFVNPMRRGGGVKLKTIHAVAKGIPVVSTAVGIEGSGLVGGVHVDVASTPQEFAAAVSQLLNNPAFAADRALAASLLLSRLYDTKANIGTLVAALQERRTSIVHGSRNPGPERADRTGTLL